MKVALTVRVHVSVIEYWILRFICDLVLEIWDFIAPKESLMINDTYNSEVVTDVI